MQSSATVAVRAFVMLACVAGIPALAMSGTSWSAILEKFQNLHWPAAVSWGGICTASSGGICTTAAPASPPAPAPAPDTAEDIQQRLQGLGATYYRLESWGNQQQLYRFCCRMAVGENAGYTHYFEAVHADPLQAMRQVLQQVEVWKEGVLLPKAHCRA